MTYFLVTILCLHALVLTTSLVQLSFDRTTTGPRAQLAIAVAVSGTIVAWSTYLLATHTGAL